MCEFVAEMTQTVAGLCGNFWLLTFEITLIHRNHDIRQKIFYF